MSITGWAGLIHARTARADFRPQLLARPEDLYPVDWVRKQILTLTPNLRDRHPDRPIWGVFANDTHVVAGLACWTSLLSKTMIDEQRVGSQGATEPGRSLYAFVGYCAKWANVPLCLPPMDPSAFADLYERLVGPRWMETFQDRSWENATLTQYTEETTSLWLEASPPSRFLNRDRRCVLLHREDDAAALWNDALTAMHPVSLVIGLTQRQSALKKNTWFLDATLPGIEAVESVPRPTLEPVAEASQRTGGKDRESKEDGEPSPRRDNRLALAAAFVIVAVAFGGILLVSGMLGASRK